MNLPLGIKPGTVYRAFKYTIYALLTSNIFFFFFEEHAARAQVFGDGIAWRQMIEAYSATIDTAAWVVLLLLFELQTAVLPDAKLRGSLKWMLWGISSVCYLFIVYAWYGYLTKFGTVSNILPFATEDVCGLIGAGFTYAQDLDQYPPLDATVCAALQGQALWQIADTQIIGTAESLAAIARLAIVDVVNSTDWLVIVALLQIEIMLQVRDRLGDRLVNMTKWVKGFLYSVLLACAIYWGVKGDFLDFWDAFLWLVAFAFIEMNVFQWHEQERDQAEGAAPSPKPA